MAMPGRKSRETMTSQKTESRPSSDAMALAEELRRSIGTFVRAIRQKTATGRSAPSETLGLLEREGAMSVAALAQRRSVTHQSMRVVVAQLMATGMVDRNPDPGDGRSWLVSLSDAGRAQLLRDRDVRAARIGQLLDATLTAAEQKRLRASVELLDRISAAAGD
ncbi:MAG: MarR family winged helix-turn-helix transcriptional regulator [Rhodanobacter sp.]